MHMPDVFNCLSVLFFIFLFAIKLGVICFVVSIFLYLSISNVEVSKVLPKSMFCEFVGKERIRSSAYQQLHSGHESDTAALHQRLQKTLSDGLWLIQRKGSLRQLIDRRDDCINLTTDRLKAGQVDFDIDSNYEFIQHITYSLIVPHSWRLSVKDGYS